MKGSKIIHNINVENIGAEGKSIARHEGKVIFVDGGIPGDVMDVEIYKNKKQFALGRPKQIHKLSEKRTEPFCIHFGTCGGCKWQHLDYEYQLQYKHQNVVDAFERIGKVQPKHVLPILGSPKTRFYRNKMEYTFSNKRWLTVEEIRSQGEITDRDAVGFHIPGAFDKVLDLKECWLQDQISDRIRLAVKDFAVKNNYSFFDLREQVGFLRNLLIRTATTGELMVLLALHHEDQEKREALMDHLLVKFPEITSLLYVINPKRNDTIYDLDVQLYKGRDHIIEQLGDYKFKIGPKSFFQTNSYQAHQLYEQALKYAYLKKDDVVYDLYTGTGTIATYIAKHAKKVVGIEQIPEAIEDAKENAAMNGIENISFHAGDMKDILQSDFIAANSAPDVIITDPPRAGMHPDVVEVINQSGAERVVYVSCNPATQARDVQMMSDHYELELIQPVDMFPHTFHVENIALLKRRH